jgi:hypothetical protein
MNKDQLTKLALLDNPKTLKFLTDFALIEKNKITAATSNEEIIEHLDILNSFYYRIPKIVISVIDYLLYKAKPLNRVDHKTTMGSFPGKDNEEVLVKCLEITKNIRYYELEKSIKISFDFIKHPNKNVASLAAKLLEEIVEYNQQALLRIGITPQLQAVKFLEKKLKTKNYIEKNILFTKNVLNNILETSLSKNAVMTSPDTLTFSGGDINGHINIGKIRRRAIDAIFKIFQISKSIKTKTELFILFEQACRMPIHSRREDTLGVIIQKDRVYILQKLNLIVFKNRKIIQPLSLCVQLQHLLFWHFIHIELQEKLASIFIKHLYADNRYKIFSKFVHNDRYLYSKNKLEEVNIDPQKNISSYVENISKNNKDEILNELENIAKEAKNIDEWKFISFKQLLESIGQQRPDISFTFIEKIISKRYELSSNYFLPFLLAGLRRAGQFALWDKAIQLILKGKNQETLLCIISSFYMSHSVGTNIIVRKKEDIDLLEDFINRKGQFAFYKETNNSIRYATINALRVSYNFYPEQVEKMTIAEITNNPDYFMGYLHNIGIYSRNNEGFRLNNWSKKNKKFILKKMIELRDLDWNAEGILPLIGSPKEIINFFIDRIKFKEKNLSDDKSDYFTSPYRNYNPVSYHMNEELVSFIKSDYKITGQLAKSISIKHTSYSFGVSQLIRNLQIDPRDILKELSKESQNTEILLERMITSLFTFDRNDPDFLIELASKTSNKKIHSELYGKLSSTGVVSGEFGIADAYKHKRESIEKYKDSENLNIRNFVLMATEALKLNEEHQRKEAEQEKEIRRVDFESNR